MVRTLDDLAPGKGDIRTSSWSSHRRLHRDGGMTDAVLEAGLDPVSWYRNHLEPVYCLVGEGVLEDLITGRCYQIKPGTLYALDKHERHRLHVKQRMRVICTFVPPVAGGELHGTDGSYPGWNVHQVEWPTPCNRHCCVQGNNRRRYRRIGRYLGDERSAASVDAPRRWRRTTVSRRPP